MFLKSRKYFSIRTFWGICSAVNWILKHSYISFTQQNDTYMWLCWVYTEIEITVTKITNTVCPRFGAAGRLPIFEVLGGALIKTYENLDSPFPAHTRTLFIIYDN